MSFSRRKLIGLIVVALAFVGIIFLLTREPEAPALEPEVEVTDPRVEVIGSSVEGRDITSYTYGSGDTHLVFVGGVHGGYEWNSALLAYEMIDYFTDTPESIPEDITVSIIPVANPDGLMKIIGKDGRFTLSDVPSGIDTAPGRFNANNVDLNRNFDCKWAPESSWRGNTVSAGTAPFSEPEAMALRDFMLETKPVAVVFWHSQANTVYGSECHEGVLPETLVAMNTYAQAARYGAVAQFDAYPITGDVEGWLASIGIPAITVELETRTSTEWSRNIAGVRALFNYYSK